MQKRISHISVWFLLFACFTFQNPSVSAQTITVVGTPHLTGLDTPPSAEQLEHTVNKLSAFKPTQVCVERMSGERIQALAIDPERNGIILEPKLHRRPISTIILPAGIEMQMILQKSPGGARDEAGRLIAEWDKLDVDGRIRVIGLQIAGYEFHSAVLNWSWLDETERNTAENLIPAKTIESLNNLMNSVDETYSIGVPLAREMGLHRLCTADSMVYEVQGMLAAMEHGGETVIEQPDVQERLKEGLQLWAEKWRPADGAEALTNMLRFYNGDDYAEQDRYYQWETLREFDNEAGALQRRLMYWHARTAEISSELFRALALGTEERVLFVVGSAHRAFTEADLRSQPWVEVVPAKKLLGIE